MAKPGIEPSTSSMSLKTSDYDALESSATTARFTALLFIEYIQNICLCTLLYALICNMLKKHLMIHPIGMATFYKNKTN